MNRDELELAVERATNRSRAWAMDTELAQELNLSTAEAAGALEDATDFAIAASANFLRFLERHYSHSPDAQVFHAASRAFIAGAIHGAAVGILAAASGDSVS